jgi:hypothetical protein
MSLVIFKRIIFLCRLVLHSFGILWCLRHICILSRFMQHKNISSYILLKGSWKICLISFFSYFHIFLPKSKKKVKHFITLIKSYRIEIFIECRRGSLKIILLSLFSISVFACLLPFTLSVIV